MNIMLLNVASGSNSFGLLYHFPMGLLNVAQAFENCGLTCSIMDVPWEKEHCIEKIDILEYVVEQIHAKQVGMIGFYTRCDILPSVVTFAKGIKDKLPDLYVILGGPGVTFVDKGIMCNFPEIDMVIRGEGEATIADVFGPEGLKQSYETSLGITFRKNDEVISNGDRKVIENLDTLPLISYKYVQQYKENGTIVSLEAGRGCPCNCSFCSTSIFWQRCYRTKSPEHIVAECENAMRFFKTNRLNLIHDNLIVSKKYILELTEYIKEKLPSLHWRCSGRVDMLDEEIINSLVESGCENIFLGIETGNSKMQKKIGKNLNLKIAEKNIRLCDKLGLNCWLSFIIGFPGETKEEIEKTLGFALRLRQYKCAVLVQMHWLSPDPGSKIYRENSEKLKFDGKLSDHVSASYKLTEREISLVKQYPKVFSSFYDLNIETGGVEYKELLRCYKIMMDFYPKTMYELVYTYKLNFYEILSCFKMKCGCSCGEDCEQFRDIDRFCGYFLNIFDLFDSLQTNVQPSLREIAEYERACASLMLDKKIENKRGDLPKLNENIRIIMISDDSSRFAVIVQKAANNTFVSYTLNEETYKICLLYGRDFSMEQIHSETAYDLEFIEEAISNLIENKILIK
ncbi:B12-binding domain-containing radical SAM protein [Anaerocolumna sp. MB42-C2]|uniref:B12-binding domain-containing radical SAM protein n=1 Tax=Anaerocolumna sp. MB42-C2 TaxID=3070997 RepID=UPI0027E1B51F|nr:radical SAM protein [Anaerocolumna sp. MB42-C2]WMJ86439.1 radical SAM protein [Anaerocolumna sp. MB42-C2]